ncbi:MAG: thioredoxin domain-containing protein [Rothia sp. (in: high G+C Gram-positive bacteria)]|uniref:DsbA family protein n=1 Tax=Rothia sp. (in: high G+C Gram-positive bacteria) TaxID=1885016 RepID=UPI0026DD7932|nr:thioredoxin domain-containing protein [Rothia sp. (in: high G+C Gram-positive bacteria)]MDO4884552.1 thioredoxin domain-containing protein [Rothia sp. (in: high G+C Gram-positive bacteria)]
MTQLPMTRRTLFALGAPAALVAIAACSSGSSKSEASSSGSQGSASSSASASGDTSKMTATKVGERDEVGYHLNTPKQGAPIVTLYTDYQCPYCAKAEPTYEKVAKELEGTMNVTVRNMPLSMHKNAIPAAQAVQAAELQDKHLEMANKLFETQDSWKDIAEQTELAGVFLSYAQELGLDEEKFKADLVDQKTVDLIKGDFEYAQNIGVQGTPQFAVNDKVLENVESSTSAEDMIKEFKQAAGLS